LVKPSTLGLVGLAIVIALSGFGYKLSLYHHHPSPPRQAIVVKFWIEPPNTAIAAASRVKDQLRVVSSPQALANSLPFLPHPDHTAPCMLTSHRGGSLLFDLPIPLRSPPPQYSRTA
jgi:hypothetical protein